MEHLKKTEDPKKSSNTRPELSSRHFLVRCANYRCLAYRDPNGAWRTVFGDQELPDVLEVYN